MEKVERKLWELEDNFLIRKDILELIRLIREEIKNGKTKTE